MIAGGLVVLDDDPTGTQAVAGIRVLVDVSPDFLARWFTAHEPQPVYVSTNTRALTPESARQLVTQITHVVRAHWPDARFVCRGDSTLRGHLLEEFQGVAGAAIPVLLLVPAMPAAGRITLDGRHYLVTGDRRVPVADTEYARDPDFAYSTSALLDWAEERSGGFFGARDGAVLPLTQLRARGATGLVAALARLATSGQPAALACDTKAHADLIAVAEGVRLAWGQGIPVVVRCAPPLAALLTGRAAGGQCSPPVGASRLLVVVGSHVQTTTRQLEEFDRRFPDRIVLANLTDLQVAPAAEQQRLAAALEECWARGPVAVLATPRERVAASPPGAGLAIATRLAGVLAELATRPDIVIVRGGVTSAVVAREGLGAHKAWVAGPVGPGIALWQLEDDTGGVQLLVAAGNVGQPSDLADLVERITADGTSHEVVRQRFREDRT